MKNYVVQFVGLTGFHRIERNVVRALIPDGRFVSPDIEPHHVSISVHIKDVLSHSGWDPGEIHENPKYDHREYFFQPSFLFFSTTPTPTGPLDASTLETKLRHLDDADPHFRSGPDANWIGNITIDVGKLEPLIWATKPPDVSSPYLTQWTIPFDEPEVKITVRAKKGWPDRTIVLKNEGTLAIGVFNISRGNAKPSQNGDHFQIYGELSVVPVKLVSQLNVPGVAVATIEAPGLETPLPAMMQTGCSGAIIPRNG